MVRAGQPRISLAVRRGPLALVPHGARARAPARFHEPRALRRLARSIVGSPDTVRAGIDALIAETGADELMIVSDVYDHAKRLRSFELIAGVAGIAR